MAKTRVSHLIVIMLLLSFVFPADVLASDDGTSKLEFSVMGVAKVNAYPNEVLSNDDAYIFRDRLKARSWINYMEGYETQVGEASFGYAAPSDFMYFCGHGAWDADTATKYAGCCLTDYQSDMWPHPPGIVLYWDVDNKWNDDIEWAIFSNCYALKDARWKYALNDSPRAHAIYGYQGTSDEYYDDEIAGKFFDYAANFTLYDSWRWANGDYSNTSWAIIGHLNNKGDYLHGAKTGATADCSDSTDIYRWYYDGGVKSVKLTTDISYNPPKKKSFYAKLLDSLRSLTHAKLFYAEPSYAALGFSREGLQVTTELPTVTPKLNSVNVEPEVVDEATINQWFENLPLKEEKDGIKKYVSDHETVETFPSGAIKYYRESNSAPIEKSELEAERLANEFMASHGGMPQDAKLVESGKVIQENVDSGAKSTLSYIFKYAHNWKNVPISYDGDAIVVEVAADGVTSFTKLWRKAVNETESPRQIISVLHALDLSWRDIKRMIKSDGIDIKIDAIDLVYYSELFDKSQNVMEPAWRLKVAEGGFMYLNAYSGNLINVE